jgi:hypothetical protein
MVLKVLAPSEKLVREGAKLVRGISLSRITEGVPDGEVWFKVITDLTPSGVRFHITRHSGSLWMEFEEKAG